MRQAAGSAAMFAAHQITCTPTSGPRSAMRTRRARSTGASSSMITTRLGVIGSGGTCGSSVTSTVIGVRRAGGASPARCSISSSIRERREVPRPGVSARWSPGSGECGLEVCGSHFSHCHMSRLEREVIAASAISAGEWRAKSWVTMPRATPSASSPPPATPRLPAYLSSATTGTPAIILYSSCMSSSMS